MPTEAERGSGARTAVAFVFVLAAGLVLGAAGTYQYLRYYSPEPPVASTALPPSTTAPLPTPEPSPMPQPSAEPEATPVAALASPEPAAAGAPTTTASPRSRRVREARVRPPGSGARPLPSGAPAEPKEPEAGAGPSRPRRFVLGSTTVANLRPIGADLRGFEKDEVGVKRAPAVDGRLVLEMDPDRVVPGKPYVVRVFLANDGKKPIEVAELKVATLVDGTWIQLGVTPESKSVSPQQRVLLRELPGTWKPTVASWAVEAEVTSKRQDVYKNRLTWK